MRKTLATMLVVALVGAVFVAPAEAKKKKKKKPKPVPAEMVLFFHADEGCGGPLTLMLTEATEGSNCGSNPFYGVGWELGATAGLATPYTFSAIEGLPFVLDGSKPIVATVQVSAYVSNVGGSGTGSGVGQSTLVGSLSGVSDGETVDLGTAETTYTVTPAQGIYEVVLEFDAIADLDKATLTALSISLEQHGNSVSHGHYRTIAPASKVAVPTLVTP